MDFIRGAQQARLRPMHVGPGKMSLCWIYGNLLFSVLVLSAFLAQRCDPSLRSDLLGQILVKSEATAVCSVCRLEGGCNYDYIEVFDGPHHSSPLIARVCDGARGSFSSSSNFLSVRFVSDGSVTKKGFQADYYSHPSNDSTGKSPW